MVRECRLREKSNSALGDLFARGFATLAETADVLATLALNLTQSIEQDPGVNWVVKGPRVCRSYA